MYYADEKKSMFKNNEIYIKMVNLQKTTAIFHYNSGNKYMHI